MAKFVNKDSLADAVSLDLNISKSDAMRAVNLIFDEMSDALANDGNIDISAFGKFELFHRKERMGINPSNMEPMMIHSSLLPKFRPSQTLKNKCNNK